MRSNGTNALAFAARNTLSRHPDWVMICPDAKNAFNSQNRRSGITQMLAMLPQITPYAKMCYGEDADIFLANPVEIQRAARGRTLKSCKREFESRLNQRLWPASLRSTNTLDFYDPREEDGS
jgi:hypothetical protein